MMPPVPGSEDLSSDLEWMLLSGQADDAHLASAIVEAHGGAIFSLACLLLGDRRLAEKASARIFAQALLNVHSYPTRMPLRLWLFSLAARQFRSAWFSPFLSRENPGGLFREFMPRDRLALVLHLYFDLSSAEIAQVLSVPAASLEKRLEKLQGTLQKGSLPEDPTLGTASIKVPAGDLTAQPGEGSAVSLVGGILDEMTQLRARRKRLAFIQGALTFLVGAAVVLVFSREVSRSVPIPTPSPAVPTATLRRGTPTPSAIPEYAALYYPEAGETLADIARKTWVELEILESINHIPADQQLKAGQPIILGFRAPEQVPRILLTITPLALPPPLTITSSSAEIRQRVLQSQSYWKSL